MLGLALASLASGALAAGPQRIVSLNVCIDQILVDLVEPQRIAAVTHLATDPLSVAAPGRAKGLPATRGAAEDVLARSPDLVLAGLYTTPATVDLLRRLGIRVRLIDLPDGIEGVRAVIGDIAAAVEEGARGEAMIRDLDRRIAAAVARAPAVARRPTAIVYQVNNYASAGGGLVDAALALAGFDNGARGLVVQRSGQASVESVVAAAPDVLVLASGPDAYRTAVADNLRHPALARVASGRPTIVLPWPLWLCGTQHIAEAVERLVALHGAVKAGRP